MPREPRIYIEKVLYFVTARGHEDRDLFNDAQDYEHYLKPLSDYKGEYGFKLFAFALLPKRLCLLFELKNNVTISTIMHNLNSRYTKTYNSRYGKKGHLFQSRFKSILIEKEPYLLRLSRYIHLLPRDGGVTDMPDAYPYSSYPSYMKQAHAEAPNMAEEIKEVLNCLSEKGSDEDKCTAYEGYVNSADDGEMEIVRKLLHRKAFVGSKAFVKEIQNRIKEHIVEGEESKIVRRTNPVFAVSGGLVVLFLGFVAYNFYHNQSDLQESLNATASGFEAAREDLAKRVFSLQGELDKLEDTDELNGKTWEIRITPMSGTNMDGTNLDTIYFKDDKVLMKSMDERGIASFDYSLTPKSPGRMIWRVSKKLPDGSNIQIEGLWTGKKVKGIVYEHPVQGTNRVFSFTSVRRVRDTEGVENVLQ